MSNSEPWCVWVAYYQDYSGVVVFETEVEALRYAVNEGMGYVVRFESGDKVR